MSRIRCFYPMRPKFSVLSSCVKWAVFSLLLCSLARLPARAQTTQRDRENLEL